MAHASSPGHPTLRDADHSLRSPSAQLSLAAIGIAVLLATFLVVLPIWAGQPSKPPPPTDNPDFQSAGWGGASLMLAFIIATCLPFRPYDLAQRALQRRAVPTRLLLGLTAFVGLVAVLIYPAFGSDIFDYVGFERMWVVYGDNPLLALPMNHPQDWSTAYVWYPDRTPAYGPLWAVLTWPIVRLAGDSPAAAVAGYKILSIVAYAACCWLIWHILEPGRRQRALVAFAWSPLILFEVLGKVHNDILPALAMLGGVWMLGPRAAQPLSVPAGVAGGLVKITSLAAAPPLVLYLWRRAGWRAVVGAVLIALVLAVALYAPFWAGPRTLAPIWNQTSRVIWSPASLLMVASSWLLPAAPDATLVRALLGLLWLGVCAVVVLRGRLAQPADLAGTSGWVLLVSVLLLTSAVFGHYLVPAVALAAISNDARLQRLVLWLSLGALAAYSLDLLALTFGAAWLGSDAYRVAGSLVLLGPAALMLVARAVVPLTRPAAAETRAAV